MQRGKDSRLILITREIIERLTFPFPYVLIPVKSKTKLHDIKFRVWAALFKISVSG